MAISGTEKAKPLTHARRNAQSHTAGLKINPSSARLDGRAGENEVAPVSLVRPVIAPRPLPEGVSERGRNRGPGVGRIYKRINNFAVVEGGGPPRQEKWGETHGRS